ncbi:MAG: sulfotransferase family protein [Pseudomonadota bacterium]
MTLKVIGAGFGRTGTESMKRALEILGLGPCHHMYEVLEDLDQYRLWQSVPDDPAPDWDRIYAGYGAAVDWPTVFYWRELAAHFPEAKILLTLRDPDSWLRSFQNTIQTSLLKRRASGYTQIMGYRLIAERTFGGRFDDPDHCRAVYQAHNAAVLAEAPAERLIVYELGTGWQPLCVGLGLPIPDVPYPRGNDTTGFHQRNDKARQVRQAAGLDIPTEPGTR